MDGQVEIHLTLLGLESVSYMDIDKVTEAGTQNIKYYPKVLSKDYIYRYNVLYSDPVKFEIRFTLRGKDGSSGPTVAALVNNPRDDDSPRFSTLTPYNLRVVSRVTGREDNGHDGLPAVEHTLYNSTHSRFNVGACDLGIVWEITPGYYGLFFGDTYGADFSPNFQYPGPNGSAWRSNVLLFSDDTDLTDGMTISGAATDAGGNAREICLSQHNTSGWGDFTSIPTAAVHAAGKEYVHYMNIRTWDGWISNYSGLYRSSDKGQNWTRVQNVSFDWDSNFGQCGFCAPGDGYVYIVGTRTGRDSKPKLARVREENIEVRSKYEFWNGAAWLEDGEAYASVLFDDLAGELSIAWLPQFGKWVILYFNGPRYEISMRYSDDITGPWSGSISIARGAEYPQLYGSFIHPLSREGNKLYFVMSMWLPYNTYLMSVDLEAK